MPASILFTDIDGTIVHYPDAQDAWGARANADANGDRAGDDARAPASGEWVDWVDRVRIEHVGE